jgi:hypothetical protein
MNDSVMLSEAKHLWSISGGTRSKNDPRFLAEPVLSESRRAQNYIMRWLVELVL